MYIIKTGGTIVEKRGRPKGGKNKQRTPQEKYEFVSMVLDEHKPYTLIQKEYGINTGLLHQWVKKYKESGMEGLEVKRSGNPLTKYQRKKELTREEELEYENLKLRIEIKRLKKGYTQKEADQAKGK